MSAGGAGPGRTSYCMSYINPGPYPVTVSDKDQPRPAVISPALLTLIFIIIISRSLFLALIQVAMTPQDGSFQFSLTSPSNCPLLLQLSLLLISLIKKCSMCMLSAALCDRLLAQGNKTCVCELGAEGATRHERGDQSEGGGRARVLQYCQYLYSLLVL